MNIHDHIKERVELAKTYADDGAFHTAARIFRDLGTTVKQHAEECDRMLDAVGDGA